MIIETKVGTAKEKPPKNINRSAKCPLNGMSTAFTDPRIKEPEYF